MPIKQKLVQAGLHRDRIDSFTFPLHKLFKAVFGLDIAALRRAQAVPDQVDMLMRTNRQLRDELRDQYVPSRSDYPRSDCIYVLATGPSLSNISDEEKRVISESLSVGMNRYVLFWNKFGIWPNFFFLGDKYVAAPEIFIEACNAIFQEDRPIHFLVDEFFKCAAPVTYPATFFERWHHDTDEAEWAHTLEEKLFFWRGSLTCLINLLCIMKVAPKIKLVGVDLNRPGSYFSKEVESRPSLEDPVNLEAAKRGVHSTAMKGIKGEAGIEAKWPYLMDQARQMGVEIVCCNSESLLVQAGVCPYEPIIV